MLRRTATIIVTIALLAGCRMSGHDQALAQRTAASALGEVFASPAGVQTLSFTEGNAQSGPPLPLQTYLFVKNWLGCKTLDRGAFNSATNCLLNDAGRAYAHEHNWMSSPDPSDCVGCHIWTVPVATAHLASVDTINGIDKTHAAATYSFSVVPTEFGAELGAWMSAHPVAWCGADPRATGAWSAARTNAASFERRDDRWSVATPVATFAGVFAATPASPVVEHPCPNART